MLGSWHAKKIIIMNEYKCSTIAFVKARGNNVIRTTTKDSLVSFRFIKEKGKPLQF